MLTYLQEHPVDYVIVHKLDRLARSRADDSRSARRFMPPARLVSSSEGIDTTPNGVLLHGIMASIAGFYSRNLAQEVMKGMRQKAIQGGTPGRTPIGYLNVRRQAEDGREYRSIKLDRKHAPHIAWVFDTHATGERTVAQFATALTGKGLRTPATASRSPALLIVASLDRVLMDPYYKGIVTLNGAQQQEATSRWSQRRPGMPSNVSSLLSVRGNAAASTRTISRARSAVSTANAGCWSTTLGRRAGASTTNSSAPAARTTHRNTQSALRISVMSQDIGDTCGLRTSMVFRR